MHKSACSAVLAIALCPAFATAQARGQGPGTETAHVLYGDLKIAAKPDINLPLSFSVLLITVYGNVHDRQTIPNNGRYRFLTVPNGEYDLVVEAENREIAREHFLLMEKAPTDIRKDLRIEWRSDTPLAVAEKHLYQRSPAGADLMQKAQEASGKKDYLQAVTLLKQVVAGDPRDFEAWTDLGTAEFMQGHKDEAERAYKRAVEEFPSYAVALLNLGKLQFSQKNYDAAVQTLSQLVVLHPELADGHRFLGEAYLQLKKGSKAVPELEKAISLDPGGQAEAHLRLAALYNGAGYRNLAAAEYEKFLAKRPDYPDRQKLEKYVRDNKKP